MSNPWSGKMAKALTSQRRPRYVWNTFLIIIVAVILFALSSFVYQVLCSYRCYETKQIYFEYKDNFLYTDVSSYEIPDDEKQEIGINVLIHKVKSGEEINLSISKISGKLIEVIYKDEIVYKTTVPPILPTIVAFVVLIVPLLCFIAFMFYVINAKKPSKRISKIQHQLLLKYYK